MMADPLQVRLDALADPGLLADGTPCRIISVANVIRLAEETGRSGRMIEIAALRQDVIPDRYLRNRKTLNASEQIRLLQSQVCVVGLGGLGGMVTETLARMGIGRLKLVDGDVFEAHNLNRQLLSSTPDLGSAKADAAAERVALIHPGIDVTVIGEDLTPVNAPHIVAGCGLVVDCLDNIRSRFTLQSAAQSAGIPMVSAAVAGLSGHVTTIFPEDAGLLSIYGPEDQLSAVTGEETRLGNLAPGVNLMASLECAEAVNILLDKPNTLGNKLLVVDLNDYTFEILRLV